MDIQFLLKQKGSVVFNIRPEAKLSECIKKLADKRVGVLAVTSEDEKLVGIISERDVLNAAAVNNGQIWDLVVSEVMTPAKRVITAGSEDSLETLMERMTNNRVRHLPVMHGEQVAGIISIGDIVKALLELALQENQHMKDYITGRHDQTVR
jgi:CBS domain-containing protein